ncbi:MAG TPA: tRNA uridine-5-carboxymethylaminomethyl(34) synthesis GTPase MnmE [Casimicrobiaceae bacterium]|nr:tRNA uridine-5-carboxymethylaminomethyl(34) synthesis GTPase MnmE [Casimicrobiaceae bacterium]
MWGSPYPDPLPREEREPSASEAGEGQRLVPPIAAIATPPGRGGIGIVRVSGGDLRELIDGIAGRALPARVATRATFRDATGGAIDEGLALYFPAPDSYTGENVVEWHGHGGIAVMRLLLARCVELGARLAEPGEFTKRAFLNGKLDLAQAESVADVIEASTATAVRAAARSLTGEFSGEVHALRDALIELRMYTEATLDFPDEDLDLMREADVASRLAAIHERLECVIERARSGAILRSGLSVVLVGAPNVGKSSLLNRLAREDAAIVTPVPGTTRDTIERAIEIGGVPLTVIDTAGLRDTADEVERQGIARTRAAIARADIALLLVDARDDAIPTEAAAARHALAMSLPAALPRIIVHNKCDLALATPHVERYPAELDDGGGHERVATHVWLCALTGEGVDLLQAEVLRAVGAEHGVEDAFFARERQLAALDEAKVRLRHAALHLDTPAPSLELFAEELRGAQTAFSRITGEFTSDDLLGEIFSRFCIGK